MADVIDLSSLKDKAANAQSPQPDSEFEALTDEQKEALAKMAEENAIVPEVPAHNVRTAFLVLVNESGEIFPTTDLELKVNRAYVPSADDIYGACGVIQRDIAIQMGSQHTVMGMQQFAAAAQQRMAEQQAHAQIQAQLQKSGLKR